MTALHTEVTQARWQTLTLVEQLAAIGSEVERAMHWGRKGRLDDRVSAAQRALELLDLTIGDPRNRSQVKELTQMRETLLDYFMGPNDFGSSDLGLHTYFHAFGIAAAMERERADAS
jgi:hypothetical protein